MISWRRSIYIFAMISLAGFYHTSTGIHLNRQTLTGNILGWRYFFFKDINASSLGSDFFFGANFKGTRKRIREIMHNQWSKHPTPRNFEHLQIGHFRWILEMKLLDYFEHFFEEHFEFNFGKNNSQFRWLKKKKVW